jgi:hypothetical protein
MRSTPKVGSSGSITSGSWIGAQQSESFCFMPPDSLTGEPVGRIGPAGRRTRTAASAGAPGSRRGHPDRGRR